MAGDGGAWHRCPACGAGANWTSPLTPEENGAPQLLFCAECGAYLGVERDWHDLGASQDACDAADMPTRRWLRLYLARR